MLADLLRSSEKNPAEGNEAPLFERKHIIALFASLSGLIALTALLSGVLAQ